MIAAIAKVQFRLVKITFGRCKFCLCLLDRGSLRNELGEGFVNAALTLLEFIDHLFWRGNV